MAVSAPGLETPGPGLGIGKGIKGDILGLGDDFQVGRIAAAFVLASVMQDPSFGNGTDEELVDDPVNLPLFASQEDLPKPSTFIFL